MIRIAAAIILVLLAIAVAVKSVGKYNESLRESGRAEVRAEWSKANADAQKAARTEEQRRILERERIERDHAQQIQKAAVIAASERSAANRLRDRIKAIADSGSTGNTGIKLQCASTSRIGQVAQECITEYSALADASRLGFIAGNAAVDQYETLSLKIDKGK